MLGFATVLAIAAGGCAVRHAARFEAVPARAARDGTTAPVVRIAAMAAQPADGSPVSAATAGEAETSPRPGTPDPHQGDFSPPPSPAVVAGLTLDQAIHACLVADPKLRAGLEAINQAHADALTASLKPNPSLFMDIQLLPLTRPFTVQRQSGPPQQDVQLSYPIDWLLFGKRAAALASAALGVRVSEADYADLVRQRVQETATTYYDVLEAKALCDLARRDREDLQRAVAVATRRVRQKNLQPAAGDAGQVVRAGWSRARLDLLKPGAPDGLAERPRGRPGAAAAGRAALGRPCQGAGGRGPRRPRRA